MESLLVGMVPIVVLLGVGYALARFLGAGADRLDDLLRFVVVPGFVFQALRGPLGGRTVVILMAVAATVALVAHLLVRFSPRIIKREVDASAAVYDILLFVTPVLVLAWSIRRGPVMGLALMFVGASVTTLLARQGEKGFGTLIRQPWLYAAIAALVVELTGLPTGWIDPTVGVVARAAPALFLLAVGARLHPIAPGWGRGRVWIGMAVHYLPAGALAAVALLILPLPKTFTWIVVAACLAPPALETSAQLQPNRGRTKSELAAIGVVLSLVAIVVIRAGTTLG